ncbi:hypothetical protein HHK36_009356 [Tetracentron sinense]|uniref:Inositol polyphosphate-related phosphatase domain-containing protein n=1 Tax=Tetracentron sinense TaxID=13715 RepID=A0A834ZD94_TETSI|nr:hypothetical protein HHK36_009356 [Tetracentron sinense]
MRGDGQHQRSWVEICCFGCSCLQLCWARIILRKWLNFSTTESDFSGDSDTDDKDEEFDRDNHVDGIGFEFNGTSDTLPRLRRRSETFRAQYINTKELRICVGTWNVGGKMPPEGLDIKNWLDIDNPADIYVLGFQEIVPLNAGNIFGAEDSRPVPQWEHIIHETLNKIQPEKKKFKCYSDPPSPSRFNPSNEIPNIEYEILLKTDSYGDDEIYILGEESNGFDEVNDGPVTVENGSIKPGVSKGTDSAHLGTSKEQNLRRQFSSPKRSDRLKFLQMENCMENKDTSVAQWKGNLTRRLSGSEKICLSWPEQPLDLLAQCVLERPNSFRSVKSFTAKSFKTSNSFKSSIKGNRRVSSEIALLTELDLKSIICRKRRSPFVRIVSKQMVGVFLTIWVHRSLRRHIQNLKVSTVGVGVMGYIGNKGSISVSMSIYQTLFCFVCTHLTSGEKDGDELKRNANVQEIHRRTQFHQVSGIGFPKSIHDHDRIIWFGDLNYRINLSYEKTQELISEKEWSNLGERDQLMQELKKGRAFDGWSEGTLDFPPTYKYEFNSEKYSGEDSKGGRRTPAWCDRILSFGKGMRLLNYKRIEYMLSDHRPVSATYLAEVEVFCHRKLQRALTFTDAELEDGNAIADGT